MFLVLVLLVSLFSGATISAQAESDDTAAGAVDVVPAANGNEEAQASSTEAAESETTAQPEDKEQSPANETQPAEEEETPGDKMGALADGSFSGGSGTEDDPYLLSTLADLQQLQTDCAAQKNHAGEYFLLTADVTLPSSFLPIGSNSSGNGSYYYAFRGVFDGGGHTLTLDNWTQNYSYMGAFSYLYDSAVVKNLTVDGSIKTSGSTVGGIVGYAYNGSGSIENCVSNVTVEQTKALSNYNYVGGIAGQATCTITNCVNNGEIKAVGALTGGIAGYPRKTVTYCLNTGNITISGTGTSQIKVGGIAGQNATKSLYGCANTGLIKSTGSLSSSKFGAISGNYEDMVACYTTKAVDIADGTEVGGQTKVDTFTKETIWTMNTAEGENKLAWSLVNNLPALADDDNGAIVRVLYKCSADDYAVYTTAGSTAAAPAGYESTNFGAFKPGTTVVTNDVIAYEAADITLSYYMAQGSDELYKTESATYGGAFKAPADPTKEYCSFAGWVREDGTPIQDGDVLNVRALYATWTPAYDKDSNTYTLATADALLWFADKTKETPAANAKLAADINLSDETWTPIGTTSNKYTGTFDGAGHSITLNINTSSSDQSIVAYLGQEGVVKDLTVRGSIQGGSSSAGVVANNYGIVTGCVNKADITASGAYAGGIVGYNYGTIRDCGNEGDVTSKPTSTYASSYAGGITANMAYNASSVNSGAALVENCYNWGKLSATSQATGTGYWAASGGIVAVTSMGSSGSCKIRNCYSNGLLEVSGKYTKTGGVVGLLNASSSTVTTEMDNCFWSDADVKAYEPSSTAYDKGSTTNCEAYTSNGDLLTALNTYAKTNSLTAWVADTAYDSAPAFRVSVVAQRTIRFTGDYEKTVTITDGQRVSLPTCEEAGHYFTFTKDGKDFDGSERLYADTEIKVTKHIYTYQLTYSAGTGGTGSVPETKTYAWGTTVTVDFSTTPTKEGYTFVGWTDGDDADTVYTENGTKTFVITADKTLTAKYQGYAFAGKGTAEDPYQVDSPAALKAMAGLMNQNDADYLKAHYIQTKDIDMTGETWTPAGYIGSSLLNGSVYFAGSYDGNEKTIKNLTYNGSAKGAGLFAGLNGATVKDLTLTGSITTSGQYAGGIAGYVYGASVIDNCLVQMDIKSTYSSSTVGGIAFQVTDTAVVKNSGHQGSVTGGSYAGGILGQLSSKAKLVNCYHGTGAVKGTGSSVGGVVGQIGSSDAKLLNCYGAADEVTTSSSSYSGGGIVGSMGNYAYDFSTCYYDTSSDNNSDLKCLGYQPSYNSNVYQANIITTANQLAAKLNAWVKANSSDTESYQKWGVNDLENDGYPIFGDIPATEFYVFYDLNGAEGTVTDPDGYTAGSSAEVKGIGDITYKYHKFLGWALTKDAATAAYVEGSSLANITEDVTLYAVWEETTAWGGQGTERTITNAAGLLELADKINSANGYKADNADFAGYTFTLTADVDLSDTDFSAIGYYTTYNSYNSFNGTFDGGGHTVTYKLSGVTQGLFGYVGAQGVVKNVKVAGTINALNGSSSDIGSSSSSGGVVGYNKGTVSKCSSAVVTSGTGKYVGGVVGYNKDGTVDGCFYTGTSVAADGYTGGIVGNNTGTVRNCAVKSGTISASGSTYQATTGGIAGGNTGSVYNSYNRAAVSGYYAGGIAGSGSGKLFNNYSTGKITGTGAAGGVMGSAAGSAQNNYWLEGSASAAAGTTSSNVFRNSSFTSGGKLNDPPALINTPNNSTSSGIPGTLLGCLKLWVSTEDDAAYSDWRAGSLYPVFQDEEGEQAETVTVTYVGDYTGTESVAKGSDAELPTAPDGYEYTFTVGDVAWDGKNVTADVTVTVTKVKAYTGPEGSGTEASPYQITSQRDLVFVAGKIGSNDVAYVTAYYKVMNDITCDAGFTGLGWFSITASDARPFSGVIDGNGKTITVAQTMNTENSTLPGTGFVNYAKGAEIRDLTIAGTVTASSGATGGLVGYAATVTVENCVNKAAVTGNGNLTGGIVGGYAMVQTGTMTITGCRNEGTVNSTGGAGGVGGILGSDGMSSYKVPATISQCANTKNSKVKGSGSSSTVGGIVGTLVGSVAESYNRGEIDNSGKNTGGLIGELAATGSVLNCYNNGDILYQEVSGKKAAGIVANRASNGGAIENCYNAGYLDDETADYEDYGEATVGGITTSGTVTNCYYLKNCAWVEAGIGTEVELSALKADDFPAKLGSKFAKDTAKENDGYPILVKSEPQPDSYKVTFVGDYEAVVTVAPGGDVELPANPESGTYSFTVNGAAWDGKNITADVTVTVTLTKYTYTVTYTGDYTGTATVKHGENAELPTCDVAGKQFRFTVGDEVWSGKNITADVTVTVQLVTPATPDADVWDGSTATKWTKGSGSVSNPYCIDSAANLAYLQQQVTNGTYYAGTYFKVTRDLDMTAANWTGIGGGYNTYGTKGAFLGTFDGDGHSIAIRAEGGINGGLFSNSDDSTTIKNVTVTGTVSGSGNVGGILGVNYGLVDGCVNKAAVSGTGSAYVGGIVGQDYHGSITNCGNEGTVTGTTYAGGIVGDHYTYLYSGKSVVANCYNWGSVKADYAGGIVGLCAASAGNCEFTNCYSIGKLTGTQGGIVAFAMSGATGSGTYGTPVLTNSWWLAGTAASAAPSTVKVTNTQSFTAAEYGKLLEQLNAMRGSYTEWFADGTNDNKPAFREALNDTHVITFMADGVKVDAILFNEGDTAVKAPVIPAKDGYVAVWEDYSLGTADVTVNAIYRKCGDVNGSGSVNAVDAMLALRLAVNENALDALSKLAADVDKSGSVTSEDVKQILQYSVGQITAFLPAK